MDWYNIAVYTGIAIVTIVIWYFIVFYILDKFL